MIAAAINGFSFPWAGRVFVIAPECMGYRSATAMLVLAAGLIVWQRPGIRNSILLLLSAVVLSVVGNLCRLGSLLMCASCFPDSWFAPIHDSAGYVAMIIETVLLGNFSDWLTRRSRKNKNQEVSPCE